MNLTGKWFNISDAGAKSGRSCQIQPRKWQIPMKCMGTVNHTIDAKGRTTVPVKFREALGEGFVVTKGLDKCLWMLDAQRWEEIETALSQLPMTLPAARVMQSFLIGAACEGEMDKQGRLLLPENLREYAGLTKDVVFSAVGSRIEIWDKANFKARDEEMDIAEAALILEDKGFRL